MSAGWAFAFNRIYCFFLFVVSGSAAAFFGYIYSTLDPAAATQVNQGMDMFPILETTPMMTLSIFFGTIAVLNLVLLFSPKTPFWWWANFIHLLFGVVSGGCTPFAILAIVGWVGEPLKKEFYGRGKKKRGR